MDPLRASLLGVLPWLVLALLISYGGYEGGVGRRREDRRLFAWVLLGTCTLGLLDLLFVGYQSLHGGVVADIEWMVLNSATVGGVFGLLLGLYDLRTRLTEEELRRVSEWYSSLVENSNDGVAFVAGGEVQYVNEWFEEKTGLGPEELVGEPVSAVLDPEDRGGLGSPGMTKGRIRGRGGEIPVEVSSSLVTPNGEEGVLLLVRDVSGRMERESTIERQMEELETLNRILRHDVRNDMNVIVGWGSELKARLTGEDEEVLDRILESGKHVIELTHASKSIADDIEGTAAGTREMELLPALEATVERISAFYPEADIEIADEPPSVTVEADGMLRSLFKNLLTNAVVHNDREEPGVRVLVREGDRYAEVEVRDDGPGVGEEVEERLFERGEKGGESPGTGLGLYLVRSLVERYGGEVSVEENEPRGAVFQVRLPKPGVEGEGGRRKEDPPKLET